jgi:hypothetical protein
MGNNIAAFFFALAGLSYALQGEYALMSMNICLSILYMETNNRKVTNKEEEKNGC